MLARRIYPAVGQVVKGTHRHLLPSNKHKFLHLRQYSSRDTVSKLASPFLYLPLLAGGVLFTAYAFDSRAALHQYFVMPLLHQCLDAEEAHKLSIRFARLGLVPRDRKSDEKRLQVQIFGRTLANPVGLAAGFDKHAEAVDGLLDMGFGMIEVGSVTPEPQPGNPLPRMFRLPEDSAVINRYGFNSEGHAAALHRLRTRLQSFIYRRPKLEGSVRSATENKSLREGKLLGVNLGKNKASPEESVDDYVKGVVAFGPYADYLVVNISSPNTPGLRGLQKKERLERLIREVIDARDSVREKPPLLVKIAPDLSDDEIADVADVATRCKIDGIIVSNTTISRPTSLKSDSTLTQQAGGLSGAPVKPLALRVLRKLYRLTDGKIPLIGCGGIQTADDALEFARAGATAVQLYTALGYRGPGIIRDIKDGVTERLAAREQCWTDIIGSEVV